MFNCTVKNLVLVSVDFDVNRHRWQSPWKQHSISSFTHLGWFLQTAAFLQWYWRCLNAAGLNGCQQCASAVGHATHEAQLERHKDRCTACQKQIRRNTEREGKGGDRTADWRIGAQSEAVEKNVCLNALLHPNNSSTAKKKNKIKRHGCCCFLLCPPFCIRATCGGHTPANHPPGKKQCVNRSVCAEILQCFRSADSSHFQESLCVCVSAKSITSICILFWNLQYQVSQWDWLYFTMFQQQKKTRRKTKVLHTFFFPSRRLQLWYHQITDSSSFFALLDDFSFCFKLYCLCLVY